jgi:hypothetical protein
MYIQNTPDATSALVLYFYRIIQGEVDLLADSQIGACFSCSTNIMEASSVTLYGFKTWRELLYFIMQAHRAQQNRPS